MRPEIWDSYFTLSFGLDDLPESVVDEITKRLRLLSSVISVVTTETILLWAEVTFDTRCITKARARKLITKIFREESERGNCNV